MQTAATARIAVATQARKTLPLVVILLFLLWFLVCEYDDDTISETDYLLEKKSLIDSLESIDKRLEEIERDSSKQFTLSDDEFMAKASLFIMTNKLQEKRYIDFEKLIRKLDSKIVKEFINSVIQKIVIKSGKVMSIRFKNGLEHKFLYKD